MKFDVQIIKNTKAWDRMEKNLLRGSDRPIDIGWWGTRHPSGVSTAQVVAWNEEGHPNGGWFAGTYTQARPFIRKGFIPALSKALPKDLAFYFHGVAMGKMTWHSVNKQVGEKMVKLMQETILKWNDPENKASTVSLKGFNDALIETGNMYDSVKYRIARIKK